jgi:hypothetical protein
MLGRPSPARNRLIVALLGAVALELLTLPLMDPMVATRFALDGSASGSLARDTYALLIVGSTIATTLLAALTAGGVRTGALVDLPDTDRSLYLSDALRDQTLAALDRHGLRAGSAVLLFCTGLHAFIFNANREAPASLWMPGLLAWIGVFIVTLIGCALAARSELKPFSLRAAP